MMTMSQRNRIPTGCKATYWDDDDIAHIPSFRRAMRRTVKRSERQVWKREVTDELLGLTGNLA